MPTKLPAKSALRTRAHKELAREQSDVLAFVDPRRELEELPEGLETGFVKRRKRGARTDSDCVNEICELVSRGITATAAVAYIGVPWATWQSWLKTNNATAREKFDLAYECHLEAMADATLRIYEQLKEQRDAAMKGYHEEHRAWREWKASTEGEKPPREPIYQGPTEFDLRLAEQRVKVRQWHLEMRHDKFKRKIETDNKNAATRCIVHEIDIKNTDTPEEALRKYHRLIEG